MGCSNPKALGERPLQLTAKNEVDTIIVGAGAAGLSAALALSKRQRVLILEARSRIGGRVYTNEDPSFPSFEIGAEFIHGDKSEWHMMATSLGAKMKEWETFKNYVEYKGLLLTLDELKKKYPRDHKFFEYQMKKDEPDISIEDFIKVHNYNKNLKHYFNYLSANECGTSLDKISARALYNYNEKWESEEGDFLLTNMTKAELFAKRFKKIFPCVRLNTVVKEIDYQESNKITVIDSQNVKYFCKNLIVAVPLTILKKNTIAFKPDLPNQHKDAIELLEMDVGGKLFLKFEKAFWPKNTYQLVVDSEITTWNVAGAANLPDSQYLSAFITGAKLVGKINSFKSQRELAAFAVKDLERLFGITLVDFVEQVVWKNWGAEPFIEGMYSFPCFAEAKYPLHREKLSLPIESRIFFAGEHVSVLHHSTVHGAMETGELQADRILNKS